MNKAVEFVREYSKGTKYPIEEGESVCEYLSEVGEQVHSENVGSRRWYDDEFRVVKLGDVLIGYDGYYMTGDNGMSDMGLEYDDSTVCFVEEYELTTKAYRPTQEPIELTK